MNNLSFDLMSFNNTIKNKIVNWVKIIIQRKKIYNILTSDQIVFIASITEFPLCILPKYNNSTKPYHF